MVATNGIKNIVCSTECTCILLLYFNSTTQLDVLYKNCNSVYPTGSKQSFRYLGNEDRALCCPPFASAYCKFLKLENFKRTFSTFRGPCIVVIYSYNESQRDALFLKFI